MREIEEVHVSDLSVEMFEELYAYSHRPLVVRNASIFWDALQVDLIMHNDISFSAMQIVMHNKQQKRQQRARSLKEKKSSCTMHFYLKVIDYNWLKAEYMKKPEEMDKTGDECWFNRFSVTFIISVVKVSVT